ncbi:hypothetical protein GQX74_010746 [Glossina fuscipes]|nr:hypothetical protein GQX74_010746 [Glossina fuscipes]
MSFICKNSVQHNKDNYLKDIIAYSKTKRKSNKPRAKPISRSSRAGLQFPVDRLHRHLKTHVNFKAVQVPCISLQY